MGKVGKDITIEDGYEAAKLCGLNLCATLKANIGSLDKVKKIIKVNGYVNATSSFTEHPKVINGCSELFRKCFPDEVGTHSRSSVGVNGLPMGVPVEIEAVVQLHTPATASSTAAAAAEKAAANSGEQKN